MACGILVPRPGIEHRGSESMESILLDHLGIPGSLWFLNSFLYFFFFHDFSAFLEFCWGNMEKVKRKNSKMSSPFQPSIPSIKLKIARIKFQGQLGLLGPILEWWTLSLWRNLTYLFRLTTAEFPGESPPGPWCIFARTLNSAAAKETGKAVVAAST